jgi:hypothetical protein
MLESMLKSTFGSYTQGGAAWMAGFEPIRNTGNGIHYGGYNLIWNKQPGSFMPVREASTQGIGKWGRVAGSSLGGLVSGYYIYKGVKEDGLAGGKDAAVWDVATSSAIVRFAYGAMGTSGAAAGPGSGARARMAMLGAKPAGAKIVFGGGGGMLLGISRSLGAGVGATMGQAVLGTPGAFIGGYVGAAPIRFAATHPLLAGGMAAGAVAAAVGYGTYSVVKGTYQAGAAHRQGQRGINTSGSMAAFMTSGAQTMRARAVQAIHKSHLNARSALGQEAGFMHAPGKNYHSMYR